MIKGNCSEDNEALNGDLIIKIKVYEEKEFKRENDDLITEMEITLIDAILGGNKQYISFDGSLRRIEIKPGTQSNDKILFKNLVIILKLESKIFFF